MAGQWWEQGKPVGQQSSGGVVRRPVDPYKPAAERRAEEDQALQRANAARDAARLGLSEQGQNLQASGQQFQQADKRYDNIASARKDFNALEAVKNYKAVLPLLVSGLKTAPNPQGDNALIYAYAKVMDPGSVVREAEGQMASGTASFWDAKVEQLKKNLGYDDARGLPESAAKGLRDEMNRKVASLAKLYGSERLNAQEFAKANGLPPEQIVGRSPAEPFRDEYLKLVPGANQDAARDAVPDFSRAGSGLTDRGDPTLSADAPFSTEGDKRVAAAMNAAFRGGASVEDLDYLHRNLTRTEQNPQGTPLDDARKAEIQSRARGSDAFVPATSGVPGAIQDVVTGAAQRDDIWGDAASGALSYGNAALVGIPQLISGDAPMEALRDQHGKSAFAGDVAGALTSTLGGALGLASKGISAGRAATAANLGYGTTYGATTNEDNRAGGAATGLIASLLGDTAGKYAVAPLVTAIGDTSIAQALINPIRNRMGSAPVPQNMGSAQREVVADVAPRSDDIAARLMEADGFGLPYSIADADPAARQALGSASRLSPSVRSEVGGRLSERSLGQADRAIAGIERSLAPPVSMTAESDAIRKAAQEAAAPFYEKAYQQPAITTPGLEGLLGRPSLSDAMGRANRIISEEGGSPQSLGFALDANGAPVLNPVPANQLAGLGKAQTDLMNAQDALARANASLSPGNLSQLQRNVEDASMALEAAKTSMSDAPSYGALSEAPAYNWKALDYSKRGLDDVVEQYRDPMTRRLNLDEAGRAVDRTRTQYRDTLRGLNDDYGQGLDAYSGIISQRDALNNGYAAAQPDTNMDEFLATLAGVNPGDAGQFNSGFATALSDRVNRSRLSGNPYDIIAGTPDQQAKLGAAFPDAPAFLRQRQLEQDMAKTAQEVNGGSPTAERLASDQRFTGGGIGPDTVELAASAATGIPPVNLMTRALTAPARGLLGQRSQRKAAEQADVVAALLGNQNPREAATALEDIIRALNERVGYEEYIKRTAGAAGAAGAIGGVSAF